MRYNTARDKRESGLSIIELAITISIIGLLLAAVVGGAGLVKAAKLNRVISELTTLESGVREFRETYKFWPGDMPAASRYWPDICAALPAGDCDGDGDNNIEFTEKSTAPSTSGRPYEDLAAFVHLAAADLVKGSFTGQPLVDARYSLGQTDAADVNLPSSDAFPRAGFMVHNEYDPASGGRIYKSKGLTVRAGSIIDINASLRGMPYGGFITAEQAYGIDKKADDGKPAAGRLYVLREYDDQTDADVPEGCVTHEWDTDADPLDIEFALSSEAASCTLVMWLQKD